MQVANGGTISPQAGGAGDEIDASGKVAVLRPEGDLDALSARAFHERADRLVRRRGIERVVVDLAAVGRLDSAGVAAIVLAWRRLARQGRSLELSNASESHRAALGMMPAPPLEELEPPARPGLFEWAGERGLATWETARSFSALIRDSLRIAVQVALRRARLPRGAVTEQSVVIGVDALPIVALLSFLLGLIIAFQSAYQLRRFGANLFLADIVGISMVREFGPMMTAIILSGRSGAAIASELATMTVRQEVDALRTMGIDPVRFLVVPRVLALTIVQPALSLMSMGIGILGGLVIGVTLMNLSTTVFMERLFEEVPVSDFWTGISKSFVFAWIIALTACVMGMNARGGARSVGLSTTRTVVMSIFLIIVTDSIFAAIVTVTRYG